ncbi:MAG: formate--phosphoribosylaminoimidazolecarboxamide ligase family protein [Sulfolobales archaeon]
MSFSQELLKNYDVRNAHIAAIASHSALDVFDGARDEGFKTLAICERGRELPYVRFKGLVSEFVMVERFVDVVKEDVLDRLRAYNSILVPNRSFSVYVGYENIEKAFRIPIFGNRYLLKWEERVGEYSYYRLLDEAGIRRPKTFHDPDDIDVPVIVKMPEALRRVERGFFIASDRDDYYRKVRMLKDRGIINEESLKKASIEELVIGAHFNVNYFRSVVRNDVELISIDRRIQSNLDGIIRIPAKEQLGLDQPVRYIEVGHEPATIRESLLNKLFRIADLFVGAVDRLVPPGLIGPFTLQLMVTPDLDVVVYDVAFRIGGGTNVYMGVGSQYSKLYFGKPVSMGRRIAMEIKWCITEGCLDKVLT